MRKQLSRALHVSSDGLFAFVHSSLHLAGWIEIYQSAATSVQGA